MNGPTLGQLIRRSAVLAEKMLSTIRQGRVEDLEHPMRTMLAVLQEAEKLSDGQV